MTLDEAIQHCEDVVKQFEEVKKIKAVTHEDYKRAEEHYQLAVWLKLLKRIMDSGDCNNCSQLNSQCRYAPGWGEQVRYNCPFYERRTDG